MHPARIDLSMTLLPVPTQRCLQRSLAQNNEIRWYIVLVARITDSGEIGAKNGYDPLAP